MFHSVSIKVEEWTPEEVSSWIIGLDSAVSCYHTNFLSHRISGKQLVILDHHDLQRISIFKLGHQEVILESLQLLMSYSNELQSCNLQSLALVVTCRISYLQKVFERHAVDTDVEYNRKLVDAVYYLIEGIKRMMSWLGSRPFTTLDEFVTLHEHIGKATLSIVSLFSKSSRVQSITRNEEFMQEQLREVESRCDDLIKNCANPIILTPATLENVTIRKRPDEPLGLHLHSSQQGVHTIELIRDNTACDSVSKLEPGDQIVEINQQVVVGWQLNSVVKALQKNPKEVILTVRKAPRHFNLQSFNQRRAKNPKTLGTNLKQSTFPKRASKHLSEEGSFDGKAKSCSIGEAPVAASHMTDTVATPSSTADEVFSLSPSSSDTSQLSGYMQESWQSGAEVKPIPRRTSRPTILVNDVWDPQNSLDIPSSSSAVGNTGKKEVLSSYNVVMSTPELRTSESKQLPSHIRT